MGCRRPIQISNSKILVGIGFSDGSASRQTEGWRKRITLTSLVHAPTIRLTSGLTCKLD